jgi:uncharacterized membrane protein
MNQLVALGFWGPILLVLLAVLGGFAGLLISRLD